MASVSSLSASAEGHLEWPCSSSRTGRKVNCIVHSSVDISHPLDVIVDTREFQRLRRVKQLGAASFVYPCADGCRFTHCLGTCELAQRVIGILRQDASLGITDADALCVTIAALCHDLGHGPYSHLFDGPFLKAVRPDCEWTHEDGSIAVISKVFAHARVEQALRPYLGGSNDAEYYNNLLFIKELIHNKRLVDESGAWLAQGRPREKAFLFDIVSNVHDGIDVDKFDYILRDNLAAEVGVRFNRKSLGRIVEGIKVLPCPRLGIPRICFNKKTASDLLSVAESRQMLHATLYQHHTVTIIEAMLVKALIAADPHLVFEDDDGKKFRLSTIMENVDVFCRVDDSVYQMIDYSRTPELAEAREWLNAITERRLPRQTHIQEYSPRTIRKTAANENINLVMEQSKVCADMLNELVASAEGVSHNDVFVLPRRMFGGLDGFRHPMSEVLVYDKREEHPTATRLDKEWLELRAPQDATLCSIALYVSRSVPDEQAQQLTRQFKLLLARYGIGPEPDN